MDGSIFSKDQPIIGAPNSVLMELQDCTLPLLEDVIPTDKQVTFKNLNVTVLVCSMPRKAGTERKIENKCKNLQKPGCSLEDMPRKLRSSL
jgi:malate dehydrogenase